MNPFTTYKFMKEKAFIEETSKDIDTHLAKRCAYCDMDMGIGSEVLVVDFIRHLLDKHKEKILSEQQEKYHLYWEKDHKRRAKAKSQGIKSL